MVRADSLDRLTADGVSAVRASDVRRILDLRSSWELPDRESERARADLYRGSVDRNLRQVAAAVAAVAAAPRGTVVIHCLSGVDRTGMLAAIVLDAVGVARSEIAADYASSERELGRTTIIELLDHIDRVYGGVHTYLEHGGVGADQVTMLRTRLV